MAGRLKLENMRDRVKELASKDDRAPERLTSEYVKHLFKDSYIIIQAYRYCLIHAFECQKRITRILLVLIRCDVQQSWTEIEAAYENRRKGFISCKIYYLAQTLCALTGQL